MTTHHPDADPAPAPDQGPGRDTAAPAPAPRAPSKDPLHGVTLQQIVEHLVDAHGWAGLGREIPLRCFTHDPSVGSSLKFLRRTPWARAKVESLYVATLRWQRQGGLR
jgi:uncharacterized protein (DUF2132 family)